MQKKCGIKNVFTNSNGTLINEEYADMLLDSGIDYISLDCDGFSKEVYEKIRQGGNRDIFFKNIEYLLKEKNRRNAKTIIDVKIIEMDENKDEVEQIKRYWQERGAWVAVRRRGDWAGFQLNEKGDNKNRIVCGHAVATCAISWQGDVASCVWDGDMDITCGNIYQKSIKDIWRERNENLVRLHFEHRWDELSPACQQCTSWRNIGEMRFDENGLPRERVYDTKKLFY